VDPDEVSGNFNLSNPFSRTAVLVLTQPLTEMSNRNLSGWLKRGWSVRLTTSLPYMSLDVSHPYGPPQPVTGITVHFYGGSTLVQEFGKDLPDNTASRRRRK
jgi:hypothetical protein